MGVDEILQHAAELRDSIVSVRGHVFSRNYRLWMVPNGAPPAMSSQSVGVLLRHPGLGQALNRSLSKKVGAPVGQFDDVLVVGRLEDSSVEPFPAMVVDLQEVTLWKRNGEALKIPLHEVGAPAPGEEAELRQFCESINEDTAPFLDEFYRRYQAW